MRRFLFRTLPFGSNPTCSGKRKSYQNRFSNRVNRRVIIFQFSFDISIVSHRARCFGFGSFFVSAYSFFWQVVVLRNYVFTFSTASFSSDETTREPFCQSIRFSSIKKTSNGDWLPNTSMGSSLRIRWYSFSWNTLFTPTLGNRDRWDRSTLPCDSGWYGEPLVIFTLSLRHKIRDSFLKFSPIITLQNFGRSNVTIKFVKFLCFSYQLARFPCQRP